MSKRVYVQNVPCENKFDLHESGCAGETHFHKSSFVLRLVLTQRRTRTRKWAIARYSSKRNNGSSPKSNSNRYTQEDRITELQA